MRFFFAAIALAIFGSAVAISEQEYLYEFSKFQVSFNKTYTRSDFNYRFNVFKSNYDLITAHNAEGHSWTMAVNEFADLTLDEFNAQKLGYKKPSFKGIPQVTVNNAGLVNVPSAIDWRDEGAVTAIKNQGSCGSCWAFSSTGAIEGAVAVKTGLLTSLSEQQLVDCSKGGSYVSEGCNGGEMYDAFDYVVDNGGLCTEADYAYTGKDGTCKSCTATSKISGYVAVTADDEDALLAAAAGQPVSVAIAASGLGFQFYSSGVYDSVWCGTSLDHGVLVAGYGTDSSSSKDYWLVKNSWGTSWGEKGYIRMVRKGGSTKGQCGIAMEPYYVIAA